MLKVSKTLRVGVSTVVRVRREMKQNAEQGHEQPQATGGSGRRRHERAA
jgi:hypothetical protein